MTFTNFESKEINCKVLYCGPRQGGKSENLRSLRSVIENGERNLPIQAEAPMLPTPYFDFLPLRMGYVDGFEIRLHLYSLGYMTKLPLLERTLLKGIDGIIFVADSRIDALLDNHECLQRTYGLLKNEGIDTKELPCVFQYNMRDCSEILDLETLREQLNPQGLPDHGAVASQHIGTLDTLQSMAKLLLKGLARL